MKTAFTKPNLQTCNLHFKPTFFRMAFIAFWNRTLHIHYIHTLYAYKYMNITHTIWSLVWYTSVKYLKTATYTECSCQVVERYNRFGHHSCAEITTLAPCGEENRFQDADIYIYIVHCKIRLLNIWEICSRREVMFEDCNPQFPAS